MYSTRKLTLFAVIMLAMSLPLTASSQVPTGPGVEIDCDDKKPKIDVRPPNSNPEVQIKCTLTNPSSFEEQISVDKEWDGVEIEMTLEEDSFTIAPGEEEDFTVTFSGQSRLAADLLYDFTLIATVTNVANLDWPEALSSNATVEGELGIEMFGMVDLSVADKSTRTLSSGEEIPLTFQAQNNGNSNDDIRIVIENQNELEEAGFTFPGGATLTVSVEKGSTSDTLEFTLRSPSDIPEDVRYQITLQASSVNDDDATLSETTLSIQLEANTGAGSLGGGLEELSKDDAVLYGGIAAAGLFGIILIVALSKALRKRADSQPMYVPPVDVEDEEETEAEFDFEDLDDLDDMLDDVDDLDDVFADL